MIVNSWDFSRAADYMPLTKGGRERCINILNLMITGDKDAVKKYFRESRFCRRDFWVNFGSHDIKRFQMIYHDKFQIRRKSTGYRAICDDILRYFTVRC